jgi:hypothetical protein
MTRRLWVLLLGLVALEGGLCQEPSRSAQAVGPVAGVPPLFVMAATGNEHSLGIRSDGTLWAWGLNWNGQLGDGSIEDRTTPVRVVDPLGGR